MGYTDTISISNFKSDSAMNVPKIESKKFVDDDGTNLTF